jgi:RNA polymerase sigma-70 factor (ECF subfamily)
MFSPLCHRNASPRIVSLSFSRLFGVSNRRPSAVLLSMDTKDATGNSTESGDRIASTGIDRVDWGQFLTAHRDRLRRMVALRLDHRLRGRIDPSDVIQEAFVEATERRPEYVREPDPMPPFLWLRFLTLQRLQLVHRQQLGTKSRDAGREVSIHSGTSPAASSGALAAQLLARDTRASEVAIRDERKRRLLGVLEGMNPIDREVLVLRHFEQLTNGECARVLGLSESAATNRYLRALKRLKDILCALPGGAEEVGA